MGVQVKQGEVLELSNREHRYAVMEHEMPLLQCLLQ